MTFLLHNQEKAFYFKSKKDSQKININYVIIEWDEFENEFLYTSAQIRQTKKVAFKINLENKERTRILFKIQKFQITLLKNTKTDKKIVLNWPFSFHYFLVSVLSIPY